MKRGVLGVLSFTQFGGWHNIAVTCIDPAKGLLSRQLAPSILGQRVSTYVLNLNHVTLAVSDLERTREFYQSILGLKAYKQDEVG